MAIGTDTITVYLGEDIIIPFSMVTEDDITGWTIELTVKSATDRITLAATVLSASTFEVPVADTDYESILRPGTYLYDVWRTDAGEETLIARGDFVVERVARNVVTA